LGFLYPGTCRELLQILGFQVSGWDDYNMPPDLALVCIFPPDRPTSYKTGLLQIWQKLATYFYADKDYMHLQYVTDWLCYMN